MFFLHNLERRVTLHPSYFGRNMHELVTTKLVKDVEGTCAGDYYIIAIMDTFDVSEGRILPGSGLAEFTVGYRAVVWRPFKGEVVGHGLAPCSRFLSLTQPDRRHHPDGESSWLLCPGRATTPLHLLPRMNPSSMVHRRAAQALTDLAVDAR
jgi:hypothetical protein